MKTSRKVLSILTCVVMPSCIITPFIAVGCASKDPTPVTKELKLDTSAFGGINLVEHGSTVSCVLRATYDNEDVELNTVKFSYSEDDILSASWNKSSQEVELSPLAVGRTTLTINATDENNHSATASVSLTVNEQPVTQNLVIDTSSFVGISLVEDGENQYCKLKAKVDGENVNIEQATFSYTKSNVVSASWDKSSQNVIISIIGVGTTKLTIIAKDKNNHSGKETVTLTVDSKPIEHQLDLDTSNFNGVKVVLGHNDINCKLTATYDESAAVLDTVTFSYSKQDVLTASWDKANQQVNLIPITLGDVILTMNATDENNHQASIQVTLTVSDDSTINLSIDTSLIQTNQNLGNDTSYALPATFGTNTTTIKSVSFSYGTSNVVSGSWDNTNKKVVISPSGIGTTTVTLFATDINNHTATGTATLTVDSKIHEFINNRTFTLRTYDNPGSQYLTFGTMWLFYHETAADKKLSNYTYYALTNNHVSSGMVGYGTDSPISFAYQNWDDAKGESTTISIDDVETTGNANVYNSLTSSWGPESTSSKFKTLFTSYLKVGDNKFYNDMTICKVDFGNYATTSLATSRLNDLNTYGNNHNNYLLQFDDYSDVSSEEDNNTVFAGGYPLSTFGGASIYDRATKFQKMMFKNTSPHVYVNMNTMLYYYRQYASRYGKSTVYNANCELQENSYLYAPDWEGVKNYDLTTKFGGGASGSLAIRASDPSDVSTYKATGIYWGGWHDTPMSYFEPYFTPFSLNFGKNISDYVSETSIINRFMASDAFSKNTPVDNCICEIE